MGKASRERAPLLGLLHPEPEPFHLGALAEVEDFNITADFLKLNGSEERFGEVGTNSLLSPPHSGAPGLAPGLTLNEGPVLQSWINFGVKPGSVSLQKLFTFLRDRSLWQHAADS